MGASKILPGRRMLGHSGRFLMQQITVNLQNCYGIRKLNHKFDFSQRKVYAIYAPNGAMKSSFAQTFKDITDNQNSKDRIFPTRTTVRKILDENGIELPKENV